MTATPLDPRLGLLTGEAPDRDVAVAVLVSEDGRYLFQQRDDIPDITLPGHWGLFGGGIEPGETPEQALRRELVEELAFTAGAIEHLLSTCYGIPAIDRVWRLHFFAVPFTQAQFADMVQQEGAGKGLFTAAEAQALPRVSPWDLSAVLIHANRSRLFPAGSVPSRPEA